MKKLVIIAAAMMMTFGAYADTQKDLERLANSGNIEAMIKLGRFLSETKGENNHKDALYWLDKAANSGNTDAMNGLAKLLQNGANRNSSDKKKAFQWLMKSALKGDKGGMFELGSSYEKGSGVLRNLAKARYWYEKAADKGDGRSAGKLAELLLNGRGGRRDYSKGIEFLLKGIKGGDADSFNRLAECFEKGRGVKRDLEAAKRLHEAYEKYKSSDKQGAMGILSSVMGNSDYDLSFLKNLDGRNYDSEGRLGDALKKLAGGSVSADDIEKLKALAERENRYRNDADVNYWLEKIAEASKAGNQKLVEEYSENIRNGVSRYGHNSSRQQDDEANAEWLKNLLNGAAEGGNDSNADEGSDSETSGADVLRWLMNNAAGASEK